MWVSLLWGKAQCDVDVDGRDRSQEVCVSNLVSHWLRAHLSLDVERVGDCARTDAQVHLEGWRLLRGRGGGGRREGEVTCATGGASGLLTGEGGDVVIVTIWCCRVGSDVGVFVLSSVERGCSNPVAGGSVYESGEKPLFSCGCVWWDCSRRGCSALEKDLCWSTFADICCPLRQDAMSAAQCGVFV